MVKIPSYLLCMLLVGLPPYWLVPGVSAANVSSSVGVVVLVSGSSDLDSTGVINVVHEAIEQVNSDTDLLQDITLAVSGIVESQQCSLSSTTLYNLFNTLSASPIPVIGLINGGCPAMMDMLTDLEHSTNISMVSFSPGLPTTASNRNSVALFPHTSATIAVLASVVGFNGWKRMSVITSENGVISKYYDTLVNHLQINGVSLFDTAFVLPESNISYLLNLTSRIVFLDVDKTDAKQILCEAYKRNQTYPYYVWILHGWYASDWIIDTVGTSCNKEEQLKAIERAIVIQGYPSSNEEHESMVNNPLCITSDCGFTPSNNPLSFAPTLSHDAVHTLMLGLNQTLTTPDKQSFIQRCLSEREDCVLTEPLANVTYNGKSGMVEFDKYGNRILRTSNLLQYRRVGDCVYLIPFAKAVLNGEAYDVILLPNESSVTIWPNGVPFDGSPLEKKVITSLVAITSVYTLATAGIIFAIVCFTFTVAFRNTKIIRLTSPNLNYCIDFGAIILYGSLYIRVLPVTDIAVWNVMCHGLVWTNTLGFILCFGPVFAKVWRIYYIFRNPTSKKKHVKDIYLLLMVLVMVIVALVLLVIGSSVPGIRPEPYYGPFLDDPTSVNEYGITVNHLGINCFTFLSFSWVIFLSVCITIVEMGAVFLAIKTRKIKIKPLNEYKEITIIAYVTTVATFEASIVAIVLSGHDTLTESLLSTAFFIMTTTILGLIHIPKMVSLYKDPKGEKVFDAMINEAAGNGGIGGGQSNGIGGVAGGAGGPAISSHHTNNSLGSQPTLAEKIRAATAASTGTTERRVTRVTSLELQDNTGRTLRHHADSCSSIMTVK